jgi:hydrogenase maturation protease
MGVPIAAAPGLRSGTRRVLVLGYGNPGRRDDGLGPRLAEELSRLALPGVDVDSAYQLQAEDAAAVADHEVVVFVDADVSCADPFELRPILPAGEPRFSTHSLAPETVLSMAWKYLEALPEAYVLAIRGEDFDGFGEGLSDRARRNLSAALGFIEKFLEERTSSCEKAST